MRSPKTGTILVYVLLTVVGVVIAPLVAILMLSTVDLEGSSAPPRFSGEFDLSQETNYEPCLRGPGGCPCLRSGDCVERLRAFEDHPVYWLGESFEGLPLTSVDMMDFSEPNGLPIRELSIDYGSCIIQSGQEGCGIPLTIHIARFCESPTGAGKPPGDGDRIREAEASTGGDWVYLRTSNLAINIQGGGEVGGAKYVALNLVRANGGEPSSPSEPFEPPISECYPATPSP